MSTFKYSLRARTGKTESKTVLAATSTADQDIEDRNSPSPVARRLFSDVVSGQKSPTPRGGPESVVNPSDEGDSPFADLDATKRSDDQDDPTPDQGLNRWITDHPNIVRRSRSISPLGKAAGTINPKAGNPVPTHNDAPAADLLAAAEERLTAAQKNKIKRRYKKVANVNDPARSSSPSDVEEGPSKKKGKGIDPSNWGNLDLNEEELDPEAQQTALDSLKQEQLRKKSRKEPAVPVNKTAIRGSRIGRDASVPHEERVNLATRYTNTRPIRQIPVDSYIGQTLNNIHRLGISKRRSGDDPSSSSSSSSSSSESNKSSDDPEADDPDSDEDRPNQQTSTSRKRRSHSKGKGKSKSKRSRKSGLKPIVPKEYDGSPDARAFNRFVTEGTAYVVNGRVPRKQ